MIRWKKLAQNIPHIVRLNKKSNYEVLEILDFKDGNTRGESRMDVKQIILLKDLGAKEKVMTLWHEVAHALSYEFGADLTERQVLALEQALPYIIEFVTELHKDKK